MASSKVFITGASSGIGEAIARRIEAEGGKVCFALVLLDREEGGRANIEARGVRVFSAFARSAAAGVTVMTWGRGRRGRGAGAAGPAACSGILNP